MNQSNVKKLAVAGLLCALAVVGSMFIVFPVFGSKCAPVQHMVNILCAVFLGPWYGVGVAFGASLIRNLLGVGSLMAFPGSMCGALLCGLMLAGANFIKMMLVDRWMMHNPAVTVAVAAVVCATLVCTVLCAKVVGCSLPILAEKLGLDPAVMASPFISTVVDAISLLVYFQIATAVLHI